MRIQTLKQYLNFIPTPIVYNKDKLNEEFESLYKMNKTKRSSKENRSNKLTTEEQILNSQKGKMWSPHKNHHTVLT